MKKIPNELTFLGLDEAGRGSVIGPLVMGAVIADEKTIKEYNASPLTDSKKLSQSKREELKKYIEQTCLKSIPVDISPIEIDNALGNNLDNLNLLELRVMEQIISNNIVTEVIIDAISTPFYCTSKLGLILKKNDPNGQITRKSKDTIVLKRTIEENIYLTKIIAQNKADLNFKIVSAASIIAKTKRDQEIRNLEREFSLKEGILASGYANKELDEFLKTYKEEIKRKEFPFIRYSWNWEPLQKLISKHGKQKKLFL